MRWFIVTKALEVVLVICLGCAFYAGAMNGFRHLDVSMKVLLACALLAFISTCAILLAVKRAANIWQFHGTPALVWLAVALVWSILHAYGVEAGTLVALVVASAATVVTEAYYALCDIRDYNNKLLASGGSTTTP